MRRYVHGPGMDAPLVRYDYTSAGALEGRRWLLADERGSIYAHADEAGAIIQINTYDEYGRPGNSNQGRFGYTGQIWLAEAGLYHYKARAYHAELGVFMQSDPIGHSGGINLYAYVGGDPVTNDDPTGLCTGSRIKNKNGTCKSTGGYTTGVSGALQGMMIRRAAAEVEGLFSQLADDIRSINPNNLTQDNRELFNKLNILFSDGTDRGLSRADLNVIAFMLDGFAAGLSSYIRTGDLTVIVSNQEDWPEHLRGSSAITDAATHTIYGDSSVYDTSFESVVSLIGNEALHLIRAGDLGGRPTSQLFCSRPGVCHPLSINEIVLEHNRWHAFLQWNFNW
jgi:RHS repeat-associated protein